MHSNSFVIRCLKVCLGIKVITISAEHHVNALMISVRDEGIGIAADQQADSPESPRPHLGGKPGTWNGNNNQINP